MRALLDAGRLLRSILGFTGRYRAASLVGLILAVGWIVFGAVSGAYADECATEPAAGCGTELRPYVVKPEGTTGLLVRPDGTIPVEVTNWPPAPPSSPTASEVAMTDAQFAALLAAGGFMVALQASSLFVQIGHHGG